MHKDKKSRKGQIKRTKKDKTSFNASQEDKTSFNASQDQENNETSSEIQGNSNSLNMTEDQSSVNFDLNTEDQSSVNFDLNTEDQSVNIDLNTEDQSSVNIDLNTEDQSSVNFNLNTGDQSSVNFDLNTGDQSSVNFDLNTENQSSVHFDLNTEDQACGNKTVKNSNDDIIRKEFYLRMALEQLSSPSPAYNFFCETLRPKILESVRNNEILFRAMLEAVHESVNKPTADKNVLQFKMPASFMDFMLCDDQHFQEMLHLTRNTVKVIINNLRGIPCNLDENSTIPDDGPQPNEPLDKMLYLVLWYLRGKYKMEDAVKMFELGTIENAKALFNRGIVLLLKLKEDSGIVFPATEEQKDTSAAINRRCGLTGVIGVMGFHVLKSESGKRLLLQGLCNERLMFVDLHISYDTRPKIAFQLSPLRKNIRKLDPGLGVVCEELTIPKKFRYNLLYPTSEDTDMNEIYNILHRATIDMIKETFNNFFTRFERLNVLESCDPDIVMASCVIYNYAAKYNDLTPL